MTYQGARARTGDTEAGHFFAVSKVQLDNYGHVTQVLWSEIDTKSNRDLNSASMVPVADVVDAIHAGAMVTAVFQPGLTHNAEHLFEVIAHLTGGETIDLVRPSGPYATSKFDLADMIFLDDSPRFHPALNHRGQAPVRHTFAVSKVELDKDGRVTGVLWGKVNIRKNAWAAPEVIAVVADVVAALQAGDRVFALFPAINGHLPDRQFVVANYENGTQTIVLSGKSAYDREIHDMDRLNAVAPIRQT